MQPEHEQRPTMTSHEPGQEYDAHYYAHNCGAPYERSEQWLRFFGAIADRIVQEIAPRTVLDAGCAMGFLVEALRDRGVEAYGLDISEYAIQQVRPDMRPYCWVGSVTDPLPRRYDLIVCIEVLEHLPPEQAEEAVANLCRHADDILFSSTPWDRDEATHRNVQPPEYWAELFARQGFLRDLDFDASFVTAWAVRFRKRRQPVARIVAAYERHLWQLREGGRKERESNAEERTDVAAKPTDQSGGTPQEPKGSESSEEQLQRVTAQLTQAKQDLEVTEAQLRQVTMELHAVTQTATWKIMDRLHRALRSLMPPGTRRGNALLIATLGTRVLVNQGPRAFLQNLIRVPWWSRRLSVMLLQDQEYQEWVRRHEPGPVALARMRAESEGWSYRPLISIVMPVYNPEEAWLREAIHSVQDQAYTNWELCIADDASTKPHVRAILDEFAQGDARIKVAYREQNGGIAAASNSALSLASGDFVGFLDHDDILKPNALYEVVRYLQEHPDVRVVYSDEDKLLPDGKLGSPFFKPDWSPDLLLSSNYMTHFTVIRRDLLCEVGGFREGYDGAQDYDLFLRVTERVPWVGHIAKPLYTWRMVPGSAAMSTDAKPYAYEAAQRALSDALARRGMDGKVEPGRVLGWYYVRYQLRGTPLVSIIIPTRDRLDLLKRCIESIEKKSTYRNFEILIVDNQSKDVATLTYLEQSPYRVLAYPEEFNYSKILNFAVRHAQGEHLLFLNNDTEVISPGWIEALLEQSQRSEVGAVGARLLFPDGRVQHEGIVIGLVGSAAANVDHGGYFGLGWAIRNFSAVTGACMMVRREVFEELGGFDEDLRVAFNDVDFCLRARNRGYLVVYTPLAELYHYESATRGRLHPIEDDVRFRKRWGDPSQFRDPYYNPNLDLRRPFHPRLD